MSHFRLVVALALVASTAPVHAQSPAAQAEVLFRQGRDLLAAGKVAEACSAFEASQKLDPAVTTLLNLAGCREKNGQLATALALFSNAEKLARGSDDPQSQQLAQVAAGKAAKLQPRLSKLTIEVPADHRIAGLAIARGPDPVSSATWGLALPVDGGTYTVSARAPGKEPWTTTVTVKPEADAQTVTVPKLGEPKPVPPITTAPALGGKPMPDRQPGAQPDQPADHDDHATAGRSKLPWVLGGGAIVLLGGAVAFDLSGNSTYDDAKAAASTDYNKSLDLWHSANDKRYVAEGLLVAGVASAGVAVWLYVRDRGHATESAHATAVTPMVSNQTGGVQVFGAW